MLIQNDTKQILILEIGGLPVHVHPGAWLDVPNDKVVTIKISEVSNSDSDDDATVPENSLT